MKIYKRNDKKIPSPVKRGFCESAAAFALTDPAGWPVPLGWKHASPSDGETRQNQIGTLQSSRLRISTNNFPSKVLHQKFYTKRFTPKVFHLNFAYFRTLSSRLNLFKNIKQNISHIFIVRPGWILFFLLENCIRNNSVEYFERPVIFYSKKYCIYWMFQPLRICVCVFVFVCVIVIARV